MSVATNLRQLIESQDQELAAAHSAAKAAEKKKKIFLSALAEVEAVDQEFGVGGVSLPVVSDAVEQPKKRGRGRPPKAEGSKSAAVATGKRGRRPGNEPSLKEVVKKVLKKHKSGLRSKEIAKYVILEGYQSASLDKTLPVALHTLKSASEVNHSDDGTYTLKVAS